jgi:hypothetical protein
MLGEDLTPLLWVVSLVAGVATAALFSWAWPRVKPWVDLWRARRAEANSRRRAIRRVHEVLAMRDRVIGPDNARGSDFEKIEADWFEGRSK